MELEVGRLALGLSKVSERKGQGTVGVPAVLKQSQQVDRGLALGQRRRTWRYSCSWAGLSRSTFNAVLIGPGAIVIDAGLEFEYIHFRGREERVWRCVKCSRGRTPQGGMEGFMHGGSGQWLGAMEQLPLICLRLPPSASMLPHHHHHHHLLLLLFLLTSTPRLPRRMPNAMRIPRSV